MARILNGVIKEIYNLEPYSGSISQDTPNTDNRVRLFELPLDNSVLEIPCFLYPSVEYTDNCCVAILQTLGFTPIYTTVSVYMKDVLLQKYPTPRLIKLPVDPKFPQKQYYATFGAIFDASYNPLLMCSWEVVRTEGYTYFRKVRPILRIAPCCFDKNTVIEKFIVNKMLQEALQCSAIYTDDGCRRIKVEIDDCPFLIRQADTPSISTTNKELLQIALDRIDEVLQ